MIGAKLGIHDLKEEDIDFIQRLLSILTEGQFDYTNFFVALTRYRCGSLSVEAFSDAFNHPNLSEWLIKWEERYQHSTQESTAERLRDRFTDFIIFRWETRLPVYSVFHSEQEFLVGP